MLAAVKVAAGFLTSSVAVLSDGIDSALDVLTSSITLVAARITSKPPDINHPYGHSRAEAIATKSLSFVVFFAGAQLGISTVLRLVRGEIRELPSSIALWITGISIVGKLVLAIHKFTVGKRTESPMLIADAKNMRADIAISVGVLLGLGFTFLLDLPLLDGVTAMLVSAWIMVVAFRIFLESTDELMEGYEDPLVYQQIFDAVAKVPGAEHPHRTRVRTVGLSHIVDLDIEVDASLTVRDAHEIARATENAIRHALNNVYDVLVHVEPIGNIEDAERYGVSQRNLDDLCE